MCLFIVDSVMVYGVFLFGVLFLCALRMFSMFVCFVCGLLCDVVRLVLGRCRFFIYIYICGVCQCVRFALMG